MPLYIRLAMQISFHPLTSSVSTALATFLYQIGTGSAIDARLFIYSQLLQHVGMYGVKISFPRFFSSLLLHLNPRILID